MRSVIVCLAVFVSSAAAQPDADGYTWATIDHAGNRATNASETPLRPTVGLGSVGYEYRMANTEVTVGQWFEFVRAFEPFYQYPGAGTIASSDFTSISIRVAFGNIEIHSWASPGQSADMSFEYAARYCNWLHNGKVNEAWAFESGAYDTSTFTQNPDGTYNHQPTRSEGARYWIPSHDEWVKAAYYDPNRSGEGEEGYWLYPNQSDVQSVGNLLPEEGGERNAGNWNDYPWPLDVGAFSHVRSHYGLFDLAGGVTEWTETLDPVISGRRFVRGSSYFDYGSDDLFNYDRMDSFTSRLADFSSAAIGLRLASAIPCPADLAPPTGTLNAADLTAYLDLYHTSDPAADLADPLGTLNFFDLAAYLQAFSAGCP